MTLCRDKQDSIRNCVIAVSTLLTRWYKENKITDQDRALAKLYLKDILDCTAIYARPVDRENKKWKNLFRRNHKSNS